MNLYNDDELEELRQEAEYLIGQIERVQKAREERYSDAHHMFALEKMVKKFEKLISEPSMWKQIQQLIKQ